MVCDKKVPIVSVIKILKIFWPFYEYLCVWFLQSQNHKKLVGEKKLNLKYKKLYLIWDFVCKNYIFQVASYILSIG